MITVYDRQDPAKGRIPANLETGYYTFIYEKKGGLLKDLIPDSGKLKLPYKKTIQGKDSLILDIRETPNHVEVDTFINTPVIAILVVVGLVAGSYGFVATSGNLEKIVTKGKTPVTLFAMTGVFVGLALVLKYAKGFK